jgi:hypothetical protein
MEEDVCGARTVVLVLVMFVENGHVYLGVVVPHQVVPHRADMQVAIRGAHLDPAVRDIPVVMGNVFRVVQELFLGMTASVINRVVTGIITV